MGGVPNRIISDRAKGFTNESEAMKTYCKENGIKHTLNGTILNAMIVAVGNDYNKWEEKIPEV